MVTSFMTMMFLSCHVTSSIVFRMARKRWIPSGLTPAETAAARRWRSSIFCRALVLSLSMFRGCGGGTGLEPASFLTTTSAMKSRFSIRTSLTLAFPLELSHFSMSALVGWSNAKTSPSITWS
uniref:Putative secreted protein n=1 Tax=Ixodes ricinus TaxID=34613 RepID=A0A6B0UP23_IXORI